MWKALNEKYELEQLRFDHPTLQSQAFVDLPVKADDFKTQVFNSLLKVSEEKVLTGKFVTCDTSVFFAVCSVKTTFTFIHFTFYHFNSD